MAVNIEMQSCAARLRTFETPHQLSKRRASSQVGSKKKGGNTIEWPHERPTPDDLARAGFFYRPAQESEDNVQCFFCAVKLDGWEPQDDPVAEHLSHSASCQWAQCHHAAIVAQQALQNGQEDGLQDPMSEEMVAARKATFTAAGGAGWPHEGKRGWKCKVSKMVEAGWCFDPAPGSADVGEEGDGDGVTCFYCQLSLDGWEPKDDPLEEHRRRKPDCAFLALLERFGTKTAKTKGKKGKGERASTASKVSRMSTQSAVSATFSEVPSFADVGDDAAVEAGVDDSIVSTASQATATGPTKGKKKGGRAKAPAKGAKGRKKGSVIDSEAEVEPVYPDLRAEVASQQVEEESAAVEQPAPPPPAKKTRKGTRQSKQQQIDSSIVEISSLDVAPPKKKATRGRKAKTQPEPEGPEADADDSEVSAQLQEELERSMTMDVGVDDATPQPQPAPSAATKTKRGVKRTSEGLEKQESEDVSAVIDEFPAPPAKPLAAAKKGMEGRKPSKQATEDGVLMSESEAELAKTTKTKKAPAKKKGRKASSTRSSKATVIAEPEVVVPTQDDENEDVEDLERDERQIEAELQRIADEQRAHAEVQAEQDKLAEYEPSPHAQKHVNEIMVLEEELRAEIESLDGTEGKNMANYIASVAATSPPALPPTHHVKEQVVEEKKENTTPSPNSSDKENNPASLPPPPPQTSPSKSQQLIQQPPFLSPTKEKTIRIPLASTTPNRLSPSKTPSKRLVSPSKPIARITSTIPWEPKDTATLFPPLPSVEEMMTEHFPDSGKSLSQEERAMTLEEWMMWRARMAEEMVRRSSEEMVCTYEREGLRALRSLGGIVVEG